ncbi:MAG: nickel pincer cofactor biosynthesis protein LarC [Clostridiales bacterium]|nr:nickel pincer cofactor biosynthesis protein LarC [Clostridiales bacterium]
MKILYFDCSMGAAGDMLTAALFELIDNKEEFINKVNNLSIPGVTFCFENAKKCGITGTAVKVKVNNIEEDVKLFDNNHIHSSPIHEEEHHHHHHHSSLDYINHIVSSLSLTEKVKNDISAVFTILADAESKVHGQPIEEIHFHEVGSMDAIADITAVCMLINEISPDRILSSPINVGSGFVKCAHGILPVPAPATANILNGVPVYTAMIKSELCTPTGAALLKYFVSEFCDMPVLEIKKTGYGMGSKEFEVANILRAHLCDYGNCRDRVAELKCNIDDMTGEEIGFAFEKIMSGGALDVFLTTVQMKKMRPGILLTVICLEKDVSQITNLIFKYTNTIGIRESVCNRSVLQRKIKQVDTNFGKVHKKISEGYEIKKEKFEYDDISEIANNNNTSIDDIKNNIFEINQ